MPKLRQAEQMLRIDGVKNEPMRSAERLGHFIVEINEVNAVVAGNDAFERLNEIREAEG